jgi:hypothetical protein
MEIRHFLGATQEMNHCLQQQRIKRKPALMIAFQPLFPPMQKRERENKTKNETKKERKKETREGDELTNSSHTEKRNSRWCLMSEL